MDLNSYLDMSVTLEEFKKKTLKLMENGKSAGEDNINSESYKYGPEVFKLTLLQFLNNIYTSSCIPSEWRNVIVIPLFLKGDRRDRKNYTGISILNTCYKIQNKILNMKLQTYSEQFVMETQNRF